MIITKKEAFFTELRHLMANGQENPYPGPLAVFGDRRLPELAVPVGYAALIAAHGLQVPLPHTLAAIAPRHRRYQADGWAIYTPRHAPVADLAGHLTFALKYEGLDLGVLKALFRAIGPAAVEALVRANPTGTYARRVWFLYEWLLEARLDLPPVEHATYVQVVDPALQYGSGGVRSGRHRVRNNLPGTPAFCPMVFRTPALDAFQARDLAAQARGAMARVAPGVLARAAAFLLLKDSRSSFAIEGERPTPARVQRWGQAIGEAARRPFDLPDMLRLQRILIGDASFVRLGLRTAGGFVGDHDRDGTPLPEHISARPEDLVDLIEGLVAFDRTVARDLDAVIAAAVMAFGLVYIHPLEDGNGRLHRYLMHHVLGQRGYNPPGLVFPVSAAILDRITDYQRALESHARRILPLITWEVTAEGNVHVLNQTADFYRYFDATPHAEFLYACVAHTVDVDLPAETSFLQSHDAFRRGLDDIVDMPNRLGDLLFRFLHQNAGRLSKRAQAEEFRDLTQAEIARVERLYAEAFGIDP